METKVLVKLLIPAHAKRSHSFGRKCRADEAKVLEIIGGNGIEAYSDWDSQFIYRVGETIVPREPFDEDFTQECGSGIHFFITRLEAENYLV